ncbi:DinB family protein [Hymenobacter ruricola]|uniref:DinB family protein n=1 Tax=Hymenobacter ruricola TaxID=2791023 RepID=A0ABS0HYR0_9BACT|nr:DinB family protein [Hymenobacter ruricola]MBF9219834.1 DinB family protein [Hymenobacter ruricola]
MTPSDFLAALHTAVADLRATAHTQFAALDPALLNQRPAPASWSILECLEHLNRYSRYYNPALAKALAKSGEATASSSEVGYSWLGRKSVEMMRPANAKKSSTLKHMNPLGSRLGAEVLAEFDQHQARLLELLDRARTADLNRKTVPVEFFRLLKLRLGEALEFVVVHQQRHVQQVLRVQATLRAELAC